MMSHKFGLRIQALLITDKRMKNKKFRQRWRNYRMRVDATKQIKKLKWGVSYSVFDGEELLEASIRSIRSETDYVQVVWQKVSWRGVPASKELFPLLKRLEKEKLIDELIEFKPDVSDPKAWHNELRKRNLGLKIAKKRGVNYFMTMDVDEFFDARQLHEIKYNILMRQLTHVYSSMRMYLSPTKQLLSPSCFVNIWSKIHWFSRLGHNKHAPCLCDQTREILHYPFAKYWVQENITMHHFCLYRKNLDSKFKNSSGWNKNKKIDTNYEYVVVPDQFNLSNAVK